MDQHLYQFKVVTIFHVKVTGEATEVMVEWGLLQTHLAQTLLYNPRMILTF
jgi:hypothetical protein